MIQITEEDRNLKKSYRKELRKSLGECVGEMMTTSNFEELTRQLWVIDDFTSSIGHKVRGLEENRLLKTTSEYEGLLELMRDKDTDRKIIAKQKKLALEGIGYTVGDITTIRDKKLIRTPSYQVFSILKVETEKELLRCLLQKLMWTKYLQDVTGIAVLTASKLLYMVGDITRFSQPSKLIKYCGLSVDNGDAERLRKGREANYKPDLKALLLGVIGDNFIKSNSQYRRIYDERKAWTMENRPEWGIHPSGKKKVYMAHYHADASRIMVKRFIHEFWDNGWLLSGVQPPSKPYAVAVLGHDMENKVVPVNSERGLVYGWSESGVQDAKGRILYSWLEWQEYIDSLNAPILCE